MVELGRFPGVGVLLASLLKHTTMDRRKRTLLKVEIAEGEQSIAETRASVDALMGTKPEARFRFIQENAAFVEEEELDI